VKWCHALRVAEEVKKLCERASMLRHTKFPVLLYFAGIYAQ